MAGSWLQFRFPRTCAPATICTHSEGRREARRSPAIERVRQWMQTETAYVKNMSEPERFLGETREQWRRWLAEHHEITSGVWLVTNNKSSGRPYLAYSDSVEEALCFGWIDSRPTHWTTSAPCDSSPRVGRAAHGLGSIRLASLG